MQAMTLDDIRNYIQREEFIIDEISDLTDKALRRKFLNDLKIDLDGYYIPMMTAGVEVYGCEECGRPTPAVDLTDDGLCSICMNYRSIIKQYLSGNMAGAFIVGRDLFIDTNCGQQTAFKGPLSYAAVVSKLDGSKTWMVYKPVRVCTIPCKYVEYLPADCKLLELQQVRYAL